MVRVQGLFGVEGVPAGGGGGVAGAGGAGGVAAGWSGVAASGERGAAAVLADRRVQGSGLDAGLEGWAQAVAAESAGDPSELANFQTCLISGQSCLPPQRPRPVWFS